ncbi:ABC transporter permease [Eoetvoesiella caeni]|uniref:ABC-2 type transport system permease protein n=2 Tax=Eoetvoesiella caeni TaxID=645616 RepID=A0A366HHP5_9BURK|nr:ABC transporter permease [Eoetvoesiella caeni]MCI2808258.1 ABC transporter permease [Eoetvoesiella caeni]NYT53739.1 ABC transporter permease [Eoetvoesiella caeni]RBP42183.1 ABC-2 type transport system permease protein [Eoetvoesiella caeni]
MTAAKRNGFWRRLQALTLKETRQLLRDRSNLLIGLGLPIVLILIFGYGLSFDVKNAPVAVVMQDDSPTARDAVSGLLLSPYIAPLITKNMQEAEKLMEQRQVDAIVHLPADFSRQLALGQGRIQLIVHGSDANRARTIQGYIEGALALEQARLDDRQGGASSPAGIATMEARLWFNAANTSTWFLVPGLIVLIATLVGAFLTALVMAREWERGTLESLFVTPVRPMEILLAKIIPYFCVGMIGLFLCVLAAKFLFHLPIYGSLAILFASSVLYLLVALGLGLLISSVTKNQFMASQLALIISFLPALMLSGFLFDLRNMPAVVRALGHALPATYYLELLKSLFLAGDIWPLILRNCAILLLYAAVLMALARAKTRKSLE